MSKMKPKKYGDKTSTELSGPDGSPIAMLLSEVSGKTLEPDSD